MNNGNNLGIESKPEIVTAMTNIAGFVNSSKDTIQKTELKSVVNLLFEKISQSSIKANETRAISFPNASEISSDINTVIEKGSVYKGMTSEEKFEFVYNLRLLTDYIKNYKQESSSSNMQNNGNNGFTTEVGLGAYNEGYYLTDTFRQYARY